MINSSIEYKRNTVYLRLCLIYFKKIFGGVCSSVNNFSSRKRSVTFPSPAVILDHLKNIKLVKPNALHSASAAPASRKANDSSEGASPEETSAIERAFQGKYEFRLGCHTCFPIVRATLHRMEKGAHARPELCLQLFLFAREVASKEEKWWRVRKRQSQHFQVSFV